MIGILEAEGSFSLIKNHLERIALKIEISSTNYKILEKFALCLKEIGCSWFVESKVRKEHWQSAQAVVITGMKRCQRFLEKTEGKWLAKRNLQRTSFMLEFIRSRLPKNQLEPYSARELEIPNTMKQLNLRGG
jgi:Holliday junction resolvase-like predicted endonuclease